MLIFLLKTFSSANLRRASKLNFPVGRIAGPGIHYALAFWENNPIYLENSLKSSRMDRSKDGNTNLHEEDPDRRKFILNVGKAVDTIKLQLPNIFHDSSLDFSIFAGAICVSDTSRNRIVLQKSVYSAAVKSLCLAASLSSIRPSIRIRKIEYLEDYREIQCLVSVVLPDSVQVYGSDGTRSALWEGYFRFGVNNEGLIQSHTFDRRIPPTGKNSVQSSRSWLYSYGSWIPGPSGGAFAMTELPHESTSARKESIE